jgi:integrase/recombinase XerD
LEAEPFSAHITPDSPITSAVQAWRYFLEDQDLSDYTVRAFTNDLHILMQFLAPSTPVGQISTSVLNDFVTWLQLERGKPCSAKSLARRITTLKSFFGWLYKNGRIPQNPAEKVIQHSATSPIPEILTPDEERAVLEAAGLPRTAAKPDARPYVLLRLLLLTGIKKGECLALDRNHIETEASPDPLVFVRYANPRNRYKERKIAVSSEWMEAFFEYERQYKITDRVFPWSPRRLEYILEDIGEQAGLAKHLSFDMCRWTCAVDDWVAGTDAEALRQKLGISRIQWQEVGRKIRSLAPENPTGLAFAQG